MKNIQSLCVFCGASTGKNPKHMENAFQFGKMMAERNITLVYGGGRVGLMGAVADGVLENGGNVIGIIPEHLHDIEVGHKGLTELVVCKSMHARKVEMFKRSDAFVMLAGGLGSLDEAFEALTLRQLGIHDKPLIFFNELGYWNKCLDMIDAIIDEGFARESNKKLFSIADTLEEIFDQLAADPGQKFDPREKLI